MEKQNTNNQGTSSPPPPTPKISDAGHLLPAAADREDPAEGKESRKTHESRKRKGCPSMLDKCEAFIKKKNSTLNSSNSFTFDTKIYGGSGFPNTPEPTPKFGSFNSVPDPAIITTKEKPRHGGNEEPGVD